MERIKIDKERLDDRFDCAYKYTFRSVWGLDHESEYDHGLENFHGFGVDVRNDVFQTVLKDFVIQLRKRIYNDSVEEMITTDLKDLLEPELKTETVEVDTMEEAESIIKYWNIIGQTNRRIKFIVPIKGSKSVFDRLKFWK